MTKGKQKTSEDTGSSRSEASLQSQPQTPSLPAHQEHQSNVSPQSHSQELILLIEQTHESRASPHSHARTPILPRQKSYSNAAPQLQSHTPCISTRKETELDKPPPAEAQESILNIQPGTVCTDGVETLPHIKFPDSHCQSIGEVHERYIKHGKQSHTLPASKLHSDIQIESSDNLDIGFQLTTDSYKEATDIDQPHIQNKHSNSENRNIFGVGGGEQSHQSRVDKESKLDIKSETDSTHEARVPKSRVKAARSHREKRNVFGVEGRKFRHSDEVKPRARINMGSSGRSGVKAALVRFSEDGDIVCVRDPKKDYEKRDIFEPGGDSAQLQPAGTKFTSKVHKIHAQGDRRRASGSPSVRYIKSRSVNPSKGVENRDIFESGGEASLNPRLLSFNAGLDEIEYLHEESLEPQLLIENFAVPIDLKNASNEVRCWDKFMSGIKKTRKCCFRYFMRAPIFYAIAIIVGGISAYKTNCNEPDCDIPLSIASTCFACILITCFKRGKVIELIERAVCDGDDESETQRSACINFIRRCWFGSGILEPVVERHSQYARPQHQKDIIFEHEVADVENIDSLDCPQLRMIEQQEILERVSPDFQLELSHVDVHTSRTRSGDGSGVMREQSCRSIVHSASESGGKIDSKRSPDSLQWPKTVKVDVYMADNATDNKDNFSGVQPVTHRFSELKAKLNEERQETSTSSTDGIAVLDSGTSSEEFICEHYGKGIACSCPLERYKKTGDGSKSEKKVPARHRHKFQKDAQDDPEAITVTERCSGVYGPSASSGSAESSGPREMKNVPKKFPSNPPQSPEIGPKIFPSNVRRPSSIAEVHIPIVVTDGGSEEFICEHYGQGVACSCALECANENDGK